MERKLLIFVLYTLMEYVDCCAVTTEHPISEEMEINLYSPWLVLILDKAKTEYVPGIGYGSLISDHLVLTAATAVSEHTMKNLIVITDCEMNRQRDGYFFLESCVSRRVFQIYYENRALSTNIKDNDWALIFLDQPFELSKRVNTIPLMKDNNIDDIDKNRCLVYHWVVMAHQYDTAFVTIEYSVSSDEEGFRMFDQRQFSWDMDCILAHCDTDNDDKMEGISFLGSPIACARKSDPTQFIQAGFATIAYDIYSQEPLKYELKNGTLNDLSSRQESLNKLVTKLTNLVEEGKKTKTVTVETEQTSS